MTYTTIRNYGEDSFEEKKSEFIGYAKRVQNEDEAKAFISKIKDKHKQAKHNCYAYVIGENMGIQRYSDDGEPQGTAGIPILEVMKKSGITDCAIVVTRYFGGILLGTGGLTRAYKKGASIAIKSAGIVQKVKGLCVTVTIDYDLLGKIQYLCSSNSWFIENERYEDKVKFDIYVEESILDVVFSEIINATNGKALIEKTRQGMYFKENDRLYLDI